MYACFCLLVCCHLSVCSLKQYPLDAEVGCLLWIVSLTCEVFSLTWLSSLTKKERIGGTLRSFDLELDYIIHAKLMSSPGHLQEVLWTCGKWRCAPVIFVAWFSRVPSNFFVFMAIRRCPEYLKNILKTKNKWKKQHIESWTKRKVEKVSNLGRGRIKING